MTAKEVNTDGFEERLEAALDAVAKRTDQAVANIAAFFGMSAKTEAKASAAKAETPKKAASKPKKAKKAVKVELDENLKKSLFVLRQVPNGPTSEGATTSEVAEASGVSVDTARRHLAKLEEANLVTCQKKPKLRWVLTPAGREAFEAS